MLFEQAKDDDNKTCTGYIRQRMMIIRCALVISDKG